MITTDNNHKEVETVAKENHENKSASRKGFTLIIIISAVLIIGYVNMGVFAKEKTLKEGRLVLAQLAPVDPRSLMQGDYMVINYAFDDQIRTQQDGNSNNFNGSNNQQKKGYLVFTVDDNNVAIYSHREKSIPKLEVNQVAIKYKRQKGSYFIGSDTFFFEEGSAQKYEQAEYGGLRVDDKGQAILTELYDKNFTLIN